MHRKDNLALRLSSMLFSASLSWAMPLAALAQDSPKDMYYQEMKNRDSATTASVAYCLELHRGNAEPVLCNNRFAFASGDGIRVHVKSTFPGYAYMYLVGSSGNKAVLYPPTPQDDNRIQAGQECIIPPQGMIMFDEKPGTEQLFVILSKEPLDGARDLANGSAPMINGDYLNGLPVKVGSYQVMSNDSFYNLGEKAPGSGLVYVTNPDPSKPTVIGLALNHEAGSSGGGSVQSAQAISSVIQSAAPSLGGALAAPEAEAPRGTVKIQYQIKSLHSDGNPGAGNNIEPEAALRKLNGGARDQYIAGLNHMYANLLDQQSKAKQAAGGHIYYCQEPQNGGTGERQRTPNWTGSAIPDDSHPDDSPGPPSTVDGIAQIQTWLSGKINFAIGIIFATGKQNPKVHVIQTGRDLDSAWDASQHEPLVVAVNVGAKMFNVGPGGHVVVISERRDGPQGKTSKSEYHLLNSWGADRNGWVSADALASAMCFDNNPQNDESAPPHKALERDALPPPTANQYARGSDGLILGEHPYGEALASVASINLNSSRALDDLNRPDDSRGDIDKSYKSEASQLRKHCNDPKAGLTPEEKSLIDQAINEIIANKDDEGRARQYPLSNKQKGVILHEADRLFTEEAKVLAQGLDQADRNRALTFMLHDTANPDHINQGGHNTCNVTTIMKVETFLRPAAQVRRFVDMYTNKNGNQTVTLP